jgi:kelch-like protein 18
VAALAGRIYSAGGYDGAQFLKTVEWYDPDQRAWQYVAPMNVRRSRVALVADAGRLYAIGGYDGAQNLSSVEVYDPDTDTWQFTQPMVEHDGGVGAAVVLDITSP